VIPSFPFDDPLKDYPTTPLMKNIAMDSLWDPHNFKPLDMSKIPSYPQRIPLRYENWLPRFIGNDGVIAEDHMDNFWDLFSTPPYQ
jgi:hypothetical protein